MRNQTLTGYPSIDKPWLKYYDGKVIDQKLPKLSIFEYVFQDNHKHTDDIAIEYYGQTITYGTMFHKIEETAAGLASIGVRQGDIVSFLAVTTPEIIYSIYAVNYLGAVCNIIDPKMSDEIISNIFSNTASHYLILLDIFADKASVSALADHCDIIILPAEKKSSSPSGMKQMPITFRHITWETLMSGIPSGYKVSPISFAANRPALIEYTGGTTGEPKGVVLSNENINAAAFQYARTRIINDRGHSWQAVAAPFIAYVFIFSMHIPLSMGMVCKIVIYDPKMIAVQTVQNKYNHIAANPLTWEIVIHLPEAQSRDFSHLIAPISGADYMSPKLETEINDFLKAHGCKWEICQGYGLTETSAGICFNQGGKYTRFGSVGIPLVDMIISIFEPDTHDELKYGETGEICISGPSVMLGYYNNKAATDDMIKEHKDGMHWLHTGDIGHMDEDGFLYIDGRIKRMFVSYNGAKVFPPLIEKVVMQSKMVESCVVVGKQDPRYAVGQVPVAFIILSEACIEDADNIINELETLCRSKLPEYDCPVNWNFINTFPRTAVGKVDYRALELQAENDNK
ncbi:MAG: acyl--CoA ligase [Lachnospiraceae bacterium]|nr:acyl--CoA ligase [Lachnospiraceae bacterium]